MRSWLILLAGLLLWAAHFFLLYGIGEFGGDGSGPRIAVLAVTLACLLAGAAMLLPLVRAPSADAYERWRNASALLGVVLSMIAIVWQGLPALFAG